MVVTRIFTLTSNTINVSDEYLHQLKSVSLKDVEEQGGAVGKLQGKKVAVYKDGIDVKAVSAICTHKFCIVKFNKNDKCWQCPCHGARFKLTGEVINGPAEKPLPEIKVTIKDNELVLEE